MSYTVANLLSELTGMMHGTNLNAIPGLRYQIVNKSARQILSEIDLFETKRTQPLVSPYYYGQWDYAVPTDLKSNKVIDIKPQINRTPSDNFSNQYNKPFDLHKQFTAAPMFTINNDSGYKSIRLASPNQQNNSQLNAANAVSGNGVWTVDNTVAVNIRQNTVNYISNTSAINFDLVATTASTGYIQNTTMTPIDFTSYLNQGVVFFYVYLPKASHFTSITFRWGSSLSNYYQQTVTTNSNGNAFNDGWNLCVANWITATVVGSPVVTAINTVQIGFTYDGNVQYGCGINNIFASLGSILNVEYYSNCMFQDSITGAFKSEATSDNDIIVLENISRNMLLALVAYWSTQEALGADAGFDLNIHQQTYTDAKEEYKLLYKSEIQKPISTYYKTKSQGYSRIAGRVIYR